MASDTSQDAGDVEKVAPDPVPQESAAGALIPTGFPDPAVTFAPLPAKPPRPGYVTLAVRPPVGELTIPPLKGGGEAVTITADGTEVDDVTAVRAREAAHLAGFTLAEL